MIIYVRSHEKMTSSVTLDDREIAKNETLLFSGMRCLYA